MTPLAGFAALAPGVLSGSALHAAGLPALFFAWRLLRSLDPAGLVLHPGDADRRGPGARGGVERLTLRQRGSLVGVLWLELRAGERGARRDLLVFHDALSDRDWRRLRRYLRLFGHDLDDGPCWIEVSGPGGEHRIDGLR